MKICMIVPNAAVKGGIAAVVNGYRGSDLEKKHTVHYVESYCDGSKADKFFKALGGYFGFLRLLLRERPDIVHVHSSFGPSFYRKMPFIYMSCLFRIPVINHIHGSEIGRFYENASERKKKLVRKVYGVQPPDRTVGGMEGKDCQDRFRRSDRCSGKLLYSSKGTL